MNTFLILLEESFINIDRVYIDSISDIQKLQAFDYKKESENLYKSFGFDFVRLVDIFSREKTDNAFYLEIKENLNNENYLRQLDQIMSSQYSFIKNFKGSLNNFYYNVEEFDGQIEILLDTFKMVITDANVDRLLTRSKDEIDEIFQMQAENKDYPDIPYHLLQEQIAEQDRFLFDEFGALPERINSNDKLGFRNFISAIQSCYIWMFNNIEKRIKLYCPNYEIKLIPNVHDKDTISIKLKVNLDTVKFKSELFNFLYPKYIECEYEDFISIFVDCKQKISWKGFVVDLVLLFKGTENHSFADPNYVILKSLTQCFTHKGQELNYSSLKSSHARVLGKTTMVKYDKILRFLKNY